jgi:hypothetical protein
MTSRWRMHAHRSIPLSLLSCTCSPPPSLLSVQRPGCLKKRGKSKTPTNRKGSSFNGSCSGGREAHAHTTRTTPHTASVDCVGHVLDSVRCVPDHCELEGPSPSSLQG